VPSWLLLCASPSCPCSSYYTSVNDASSRCTTLPCAGTYFPPSDVAGRPGFSTVLRRIGQVWGEQREAVKASSKQSMQQLAEAMAPEVRLAGWGVAWAGG
jgi:hypothetical protein